MTGRLITIEGVEGAGKSTLIQGLVAGLEADGIDVVATRQPGGTPVGQKIRNMLLHGDAVSPLTELFLYLADRAEHVATFIRPALLQGKWVVCDRFTDSTIAYQGYGRGLDLAKVTEACVLAQQIPIDATVLLDLDPETGMSRIAKRPDGPDRLESESIEFHQRIRNGFLDLARQAPGRTIVIDAGQPPAQVVDQALASIRQLLR